MGIYLGINCRAYAEELRVMFGGNVEMSFDAGSHIENVYVHPNFCYWQLDNDIALLELSEPTDQVNRILKIGWAQKGTKGVVIGYGNNGRW